MLKKAPPENLSPTELAFMSELNECQLRHYLAERAISLGKHGVSKISEKIAYFSDNHPGISAITTHMS